MNYRDTLLSIAANRELRGYLPTQVTLRVQGEITLAQLETALAAGGMEIYKDCTEALCLRTVEAGNEHRALVKREREARLEHAQRHAELVRQEGERNRANGYRAPPEDSQ
jgi:hypothetical protein